MRKLFTALVTGTMLAGVVAAPAAAFPNQDIRDARRAKEAQERREEARERQQDAREEWRERREEWQERRDDWRDHRRDDDRREWFERRERWHDARDDWQRYGYRYDRTPWNGQWTPYGFGYHDRFTRDWVFRNFADRNHNGKISDKEWRRAQRAFYQLADRNRDGRISQYEYSYAMNLIRRHYGYNDYGYRW